MLLDRKVYPVIEIALPETETGCGSQLACRAARQISLPPSSEVNCMGLQILGNWMSGRFNLSPVNACSAVPKIPKFSYVQNKRNAAFFHTTYFTWSFDYYALDSVIQYFERISIVRASRKCDRFYGLARKLEV